MNKWLMVLFLLVAILAGLFAWGKRAPSSDLISADDIHWHPEIRVWVNGEAQLIPANIGIGSLYADDSQYNNRMRMTEIHTHDGSGQIHLEMEGPVTKDEIKLGNFFRIWGVRFPAKSVRATVNGQTVEDHENYLMQDKDQIEVYYE